MQDRVISRDSLVEVTAFKTKYAKPRGFYGRIKMLETLFTINVLQIILHSANINIICKNLSNNMLSMTCDSMAESFSLKSLQFYWKNKIKNAHPLLETHS